MEKRKEFWRALPFVMALLLLTLVPMQSASALFGKGKEEAKAVDGAPVAENMEIKVYRGVAYEGEFRAVDNEGDEVTFAIAQEPKKGMVALTEDGLGFVYTPGGKLGTDSFTYTAIDAYGNISLPATVSITIEKANSGVCTLIWAAAVRIRRRSILPSTVCLWARRSGTAISLSPSARSHVVNLSRWRSRQWT